MSTGRTRRLAGWLLPAAAVTLILLLILLLYSRLPNVERSFVPEEGVLDISGLDLSQEVVAIDNSWDYYPGELYFSEDFAAGGRELPSNEGENRYGTYRLILRAQPEQYYSLCSWSIDYSMRVFVNGVEVASYGVVADNAEESVPLVGYMTIPLWSGDDGEIEIIYQSSNFVHSDSGFIRNTFISTPQNIEEFKTSDNLVGLSLSGGLLGLFMYFLLCAAVQRRRALLVLALCCMMTALRDQNFLVIYALPPETSWYFSYRLFMTVTALLPGMALLLLESLYPGAAKRGVTLAFVAAMALAAVLTAVLPTQQLVTVCAAAWFCAAPYLVCLAWGVIRIFRARRSLGAADALTLAGFAALIAFILLEALLVDYIANVTRHGLIPFGMLILVLLVAVAISLQMQAQAAALAESRSRSELLEHMNAMNIDFLHQVAHELKTPLTVISGYAQLTRMQMSAGHMSSETPEYLKTIRDEASRLADMVNKLMDYSHGQESELLFGTVELKPLLKSARAICTPMCLKNGNRLEISGENCADVYGSAEMLLQILINLVINANRHTRNGLITISASDTERREFVVIRVADTGDGIDAALLPHIFEKGVSGDEGSGLGLAICRDAVEAHGGTLEVERTGPDGTVFAFTVLRRELEP